VREVAGIRKEHELLWASALHAGWCDQAGRIRQLAEREVDWGYLVQAATRLGALNLVGAALAGAGVVPPAPVEEAWRAERLRAGFRSLVGESLLEPLLRDFETRGIPCMVLKGLPLAAELYSDPLLRPSDDVDLIVPRRQRDTALEAVLGLGFTLPRGSFSLAFYRLHHFHAGLVRERQHEVPLELHWDFQPRFSLSRIPEAEAWRQVRRIRVGRLDVPVPDREVTFLYLVQHLARHLVVLDQDTLEDPAGALLEPGRRGRLTWFTDLMLMAGGSRPLDPERVERLAREWGLGGEMAWVASLLRTGAPDLRTAASAWAAAGSQRPAPAPGMPSSAFTRLARGLPWAARASRRLQFRPLLAFRLVSIAFPGRAWIRTRYGLAGAPTRRVAAKSVSHALGVLLAATRVAGATLREILRQSIPPAPR
jgi:hypothetical protein